MDAHHVRPRKQFVERKRRVSLAVPGPRSGEINHLHSEGGGHRGDLRAYAAHAHDAHGLAAQFHERTAGVGEDPARRISAALDIVVEIRSVSDQREQQREGLLHHGVGRISGHVAHRDSPAFCGLQVDVVHPGGCHADQFQPRGGGHEFVINLHLVDYQHFAVGDSLQGLLP